jgi:hypothetical protein
MLEQMQAEIGERIAEGVTPPRPIRFSTVSGNGVGKSFANALLAVFLATTRSLSKGVITANSAQQLSSRTYAEVQKVLRRSLFAGWFRTTTGRGNMSVLSREYPESWRADAITAAIPEAVQGTHAAGSCAWAILDECSAVPDEVFNVMEALGATSESFILATGNGTRNTGRFYDSHNKFKDRWITRSVDSRSTQLCNRALVDDWLKSYGADSTFAKVRVYGQFADQSSLSFMSRALLEEAAQREVQVPRDEPVHVGVDVAAYGADESVIWTRRGRDARSIPPIRLHCDTMQLVSHVAEHVNMLRLQFSRVIVAIDSTGLGIGVCDRLNQLGFGVHPINFGSKANKPEVYGNRRAELYGNLRDWLKDGAVPDDDELIEELAAIEYYFTGQGTYMLERKAELKSRIGRSPDKSDALALTLALPTPVVDRANMLQPGRVAQQRRSYDPMERFAREQAQGKAQTWRR